MPTLFMKLGDPNFPFQRNFLLLALHLKSVWLAKKYALSEYQARFFALKIQLPEKSIWQGKTYFAQRKNIKFCDLSNKLDLGEIKHRVVIPFHNGSHLSSAVNLCSDCPP